MCTAETATEHFPVLMLGGGSARLSVAARLRRAKHSLGIGIVKPSESHYYQPLWTPVGAGVFSPEAIRRREADSIPARVDWIRDRVTAIEPDAKAVRTEAGRQTTYD